MPSFEEMERMRQHDADHDRINKAFEDIEGHLKDAVESLSESIRKGEDLGGKTLDAEMLKKSLRDLNKKVFGLE